MSTISSTRYPHLAVLRQFVKYGLVGLTNTGISLGIGYAIGVLNSYAINRRWTFMAPSGRMVTALRYFIVQLGGLIGSSALIFLLVDLAGLPKIPAQLIAISTAVVLTFAVNRLWTFGPREGTADPGGDLRPGVAAAHQIGR
jgi:putative flippase GtrA